MQCGQEADGENRNRELPSAPPHATLADCTSLLKWHLVRGFPQTTSFELQLLSLMFQDRMPPFPFLRISHTPFHRLHIRL